MYKIVPFPGLYFNFNVILFALDEMEGGEDERERAARLVLSDDWSRRHRRAAVVVSATRGGGGKLAVKVLDAYSGGVIRSTAVLGPQQDVSGGGMLDDMFPPFPMQACKIQIFLFLHFSTVQLLLCLLLSLI